MFPIFEHAPVSSCILGLLLIAVQAAQLRLAQANNLADMEWSAGLRGIDETALVAGISVSQKERNLGEYKAHNALQTLELQKQSKLRSLFSNNQALGWNPCSC